MLGHRKTDRLNWFLRELGEGAANTVRSLGILGANNSFPDYYTEKAIMANAVEQGGPFRRINLSDTGANLDADEWPTEDFSQTLMSFVFTPDSSYNGTYKGQATFPGRPASAPTISYTADSGSAVTQNVVYSAVTGVMTWDTVVSSLGTGNFQIHVANTSGGATQFNLYRPGVDPLDPTAFTAYENRVNAEFSTLRTMDLDQVNSSTLTDWANRNTLTNWHQGSDRYQFGQNSNGIPNERIVALYSEAGATTLWRCAPTQLTAFTAWAATMLASLPAGKKIVVEFSNETWNSEFTYTYHANYYAALVSTGARRLVYNNATYSSNDTVGTAYFASRANISAITSNGTTATMTFDAAHGLSNGNLVTRGMQSGWDVGSVGSLVPAVAVTSVAYTVASATTITYPCTANGTMSMAPNGAAGVYFNPTSVLLTGLDGIYNLTFRQHAYRTRALGIACKAAFATGGRTADLDVTLQWRSGAIDNMREMLDFIDYTDGVDGLGGTEVIDSIGFAVYCDLDLSRIAGAGLTDQTADATTATEILDAIETQVTGDNANRAFMLDNYTALARDRGKLMRVYELGIDTRYAWAANSGSNHTNVNLANANARVKDILVALFDAFIRAGVDQMNFYRLAVGPYDNTGCFYVGNNMVETDPATASGSQSNRLQALVQVLNAAPDVHTRHLLATDGTQLTIDGRDRIYYTYFDAEVDPYPQLDDGGYYENFNDTHLGYEFTAPAAGNYKLQIRALLTTTGTDTLQIRQRGANVATCAIANRGGSNTADESLATATLALEKGVNYIYIGGLGSQAATTVTIKALYLVAAAFDFPVSITGTPVTSANVDQVYTGFDCNAINGTAPFVFSLVGTWPTGATINSSTGEVGGTITQSGTFNNLSVRVTDANSDTADLPTFSLAVVVGDTLVASDNFNGFSNGQVVRSISGYGAYNSAGSTSGLRDQFTVQSGVATWPNDVGDDWSYPGTFVIGRDLGTDQQAIEFEFSVTPGASALFWFCANDQTDGLFLNMPSPGNDATLNKVVGGTVTALATLTGIAFASGDIVMLRRYGSNAVVYKNGTLVLASTAIGTFTGGTKAGSGSYQRLGAYNYINWYGPITQLLKP